MALTSALARKLQDWGFLRPVAEAPTPPTYAEVRPAFTQLTAWIEGARPDPTNERYWQLLNGGAFKRLWYAARDSAEDLRGRALEILYTERPEPGGAHPDPREPAAFSSGAVLSTACRILHIRVKQAPQHVASEADALVGPAQRPLRAWLLTYPGATRPDLLIRWDSNPEALHFAMACVLGYYMREGRYLSDPDAPKGLIVPPMDPTITTVLHQFAIALLCLEPECPQHRLCMCNHIRARFNAPPPDHEQPTEELPAIAPPRQLTE